MEFVVAIYARFHTDNVLVALHQIRDILDTVPSLRKTEVFTYNFSIAPQTRELMLSFGWTVEEVKSEMVME